MATSPTEELIALNAAIVSAVLLLRPYAELIERFERERQLMDSVGPLFAPTMFNDAERQAVSDLLAPIYRASANLITVYDLAEDIRARMMVEAR